MSMLCVLLHKRKREKRSGGTTIYPPVSNNVCLYSWDNKNGWKPQCVCNKNVVTLGKEAIKIGSSMTITSHKIGAIRIRRLRYNFRQNEFFIVKNHFLSAIKTSQYKRQS